MGMSKIGTEMQLKNFFPWHGLERIEVLASDHFEFCNISKGSILLYGLDITLYLHLKIHILHTTSSGQSIHFGQELVVSTYEHLDCVLPVMYSSCVLYII